jgi:Zn-dependent protease
MIAGYSRVTEAALGGSWSIAATALSVLFSLNLLLFVFNLIPLPPLDGASAVPLLVSEDLALRYARLLRRPGFAMAGLLVAWFTIGSLFSKIHALALNLLYPGVHYG